MTYLLDVSHTGVVVFFGLILISSPLILRDIEVECTVLAFLLALWRI